MFFFPFFLSFFPSPGVTLRRREIETHRFSNSEPTPQRFGSVGSGAIGTSRRGVVSAPPLRSSLHRARVPSRDSSCFWFQMRSTSRVLIRVNVRYISTRCLHCAPVTKDIAIVYDVSRTSIFLRILKARGGERWACEC